MVQKTKDQLRALIERWTSGLHMTTILPGILRWRDQPVHCRPRCPDLHSCSSCSAWRGHSWSWPCCCWPPTWCSCRTGRRRRRSRCGKIPRRVLDVSWCLLDVPPAPSLCWRVKSVLSGRSVKYQWVGPDQTALHSHSFSPSLPRRYWLLSPASHHQPGLTLSVSPLLTGHCSLVTGLTFL